MDFTLSQDWNHRAKMSGAVSASPPSQKAAELIKSHPEIWKKVQSDVANLFQRLSPTELAVHVNALKEKELGLKRKLVGKNQRGPEIQSAQAQLAEINLTLYLVHKLLYKILAKKPQIKLSSVDEKIAQRLFFTSSCERKAVSALWFWPLWWMISDKQAVIYALKASGIYCVYSKSFGRSLAKLIGKRSCLEVGAGDGTLALLLEKCGVLVQATDDRSWEHKIKYPDWVGSFDAVESLTKYNPEVVLCSWPPPNNSFEHLIFQYPTVKMYIAIGTKHPFGSGNRETYDRVDGFEVKRNESLSKLIFPKEIDSEVLVFTRKP